jgi:membrane-associated phospholipid phosphatase
MKPESTGPDTGQAPPALAPDDPRQARRALLRGGTLIGAGLVLLVLFGAVTAGVLLLDPLTLDVPITREIQEAQWGPLDALLLAVSAPGFAPWNFVWPVVIIGAVALARRFAEAAFLALATVASGASEVVKALVHRGRPSADLVHVIGNPSSYSFPSGHVTQYTLFFGFCFYLIWTLVPRGWLRNAGLALMAALVLLVGPSRIWMGQHWASDVLGGYTLAFGLLLLVIWGYRGWLARLARTPARAAGPAPAGARSGNQAPGA